MLAFYGAPHKSVIFQNCNILGNLLNNIYLFIELIRNIWQNNRD